MAYARLLHVEIGVYEDELVQFAPGVQFSA